MEEFIPLFPLKLVAYPGEKLNLHIFESRYKELVGDILRGDKKFGIPSFIDNKIEYGTLMELNEVSRKYPDGRMDIKTTGLTVFRVLDYSNPYPGKKYAAGRVRYLENNFEQDPLQKGYLIEKLDEFYIYINYQRQDIQEGEFISYQVIHRLGLSIEEEYKLLTMDREGERQAYITQYLDRVVPALKKAEKAREIVKLNGHFKYFDPIDF